MASSNKKVVIREPKIPSPSTSSTPIAQNRFVPLTPYSPSYNQRPRSTYSALAQLPDTLQTPSKFPSTSNVSNPDKPEYQINPNLQFVKILESLEEQKLNESFRDSIEYLYPLNTHFYNNDYQNREYYEAVLVESRSIKVQHFYNQTNQITHTKVKILKVISIEEWGDKPYTNKILAKFSSYPVYNYYDYQEAWNKAFLLRSFSHNWFFYFSNEFSNKYPRWFIEWFRHMGSIPEIFPAKILEGFNKYKMMFAQENAPLCEYTLQFSALFKLPWIILFIYKKQEADRNSPPVLYRQFSVKWWKQIKEDQADIKAVTTYYNSLIRSPQSPSQSSPSISDSEAIKKIQQCSSSQEIQKVLDEIRRSPTRSEDIYQDSQDTYEDFELN